MDQKIEQDTMIDPARKAGISPFVFSHTPKIVVAFLVVLTGVIAGLSLWPGLWHSGLVPEFHGIDKVAHFTAYGTLAGITVFFAPRRSVWLMAVLWMGIGGGLEAVQYFLPDRWPSFGDLAANLAGVAAGTLAGWLASRFAEWLFRTSTVAGDANGQEPSGTRP